MSTLVRPKRLVSISLLLMSLVLALLVGRAQARSVPASEALAQGTFTGRVLDGLPFDESHPLAQVSVAVYGSNSSCVLGRYLRGTTTNAAGYWQLSVYDNDGNWEFFQLVETDPAGYLSVDATSVEGIKCNNNVIQHQLVPGRVQDLTGNKFWDQNRSSPTPSATPSPRATSTWTPSPTPTYTPPPSPTRTNTPRATQTDTPTPRATHTYTPTPRVTGSPTATRPPTRTPSPTPTRIPDSPWVVFPVGDWPIYAQGEISVHPDPPLAGQLARLCAEVLNTDPVNDRVVTLEFRVAGFGIGVPFTPVGAVNVLVPAGGIGQGCVIWTPPLPGHWCIEVVLSQPGFPPQRSQRNIDAYEPLRPGVSHSLTFPVGNPLPEMATITLGLIPHVEGWQFALSQDVLPNMAPGEIREVTLTVTPPQDQPLPPDATVIVDVEAYVGRTLIGGFRKLFRPPAPLHRFPDPSYAEREITVDPYPPRAGEPTELCVELYNPSDLPQNVEVQFYWAAFGIGLPFTPIDGPQPVFLPPHSTVKQCIMWVPPIGGHLCIQVTLQSDNQAPQRSQRNLDVAEPLQPGVGHSLTFPVGNPLSEMVIVTLGLIPHLPGWQFGLSQDVLPNMAPGEIRQVTLTVTPPQGQPLPPDGTVIVDVEAYVGRTLIGGFRKVFRPPVPLHRFPDPSYAEREITVDPYPPRAGEPTELCVELYNPSDLPQNVAVQFYWAAFGIGLPFTPIDGPQPVLLPPHSTVKQCIMWVPPIGGHLCIQVTLQSDNQAPQRSQRNLDVAEPLQPGVGHSLTFPVGNPLPETVTITLGLIPHLPGWQFGLSQDVLPNMAPGEIRQVTLTVTPPQDQPLPPDGTVVVDVEAWAKGILIGGFRKVFRPPVPIHRPQDPFYAEREIGVDPYPVVPGQPVELSVEVRNPTDHDQIVSARFLVANFGIGLPFSDAHILPNPVSIFVPAHGAARGRVVWQAPGWQGKFCVRVELTPQGSDRSIWSQRNIDVGEPLRPGVPHALVFPVGAWPLQEPATVTLGLIVHQPGWQASVQPAELRDLRPGQVVSATLVVTPPLGVVLGTGAPLVDVQALVNGQIIGGFRKLDIPPVPLHKPHEKQYAESEILVRPYPPQAGQPTDVRAVIHNTGDVPASVRVEFGYADFGMGIAFSSAGMNPVSTTVNLPPGSTVEAATTWTPPHSGAMCLQVRLSDVAGDYQTQWSRRNVDVVERPDCGITKVVTAVLHNSTPLTVTVDIGTISFNVPPSWQVTVAPSGSVEVGPYGSITLTITVTIPCPQNAALREAEEALRRLQAAAGSEPTIDVEGYVDGALLGGIEIRFAEPAPSVTVLLPLVLKRAP